MNYRHAYHAGNFADVLKHIVLTLVIEHLKRKPSPFRVIDTHAGAGHYDLAADASEKTGEWRSGIGRLIGAPLPADAASIIAPYLSAIAAENEGTTARLVRYPGSPALARRLMRRGDQLVVNELQPDERTALSSLFAGDPQTKVMGLDGWTALRALLPPKERRGVVLVDPPFEEAGDLVRLVDGLREAARRFATGTVLLWYPIKDHKPIRRFHDRLAALGLPKLVAAELFVRRPVHPGLLNGCGLVVLNPPFTLAAQLDLLLPVLAQRLGDGPGADGVIVTLAGDAVTHR